LTQAADKPAANNAQQARKIRFAVNTKRELAAGQLKHAAGVNIGRLNRRNGRLGKLHRPAKDRSFFWARQ
jgi:hypothetical protein